MNFETSETIRKVLGGNQFEAMVGAKDFVTRGHDLQFKYPLSKKNKSNMVKIELNGKDLYDLTFYKMNGFKFDFKKLEVIADVGVESLREVFENATGHATKL